MKQNMMDMRRAHLILFAAAFLLAGCKKNQSAANTPSSPSPAPSPPSPMQTVARIHWLGMNRLSRDTNAASFMAVWNLPESRKLEKQALDKCSFAPWRLLHRSLDSNAAGLFRPLLDDVVSNESCLEIRQTTNQQRELAFAIRLDSRRAALWETNLAQVLESLTDIHPVPAPENHYGWSLEKHHKPDFLELTRSGDWTIFGASQDTRALVAEIKSRIQKGELPVSVSGSNNWLETELNPAQLLPGLATLNLEPGTLNRFHLSVTGNGSNVLTRGQVDFSKPLTIDWQPWNIPTNLIDERLCSLTVVRGFKPWLESSKFWQDLHAGPPPDQICFWALHKYPMRSYFAAPLSDASNAVDRLADWVLKNQHHWYPTNGPAGFERSKKFNGIEWKGLPYMTPFLRSITVSNQSFIHGGGFPNAVLYPLSLETLQAALSRTNLVYHSWEVTGLRTEQWLYMGQFARFVSHKAQLPSGSPGLLWLNVIAPHLGQSLTDITQTRSNQLSFTRRSSIGFTAIELHLLADWLESPQFPIGLHTTLAPPPRE